jgi:hypothetical protein
VSSHLPLIQQPPQYCQYSIGNCDQVFDTVRQTSVYFFYSSKPELIARTIEEGIRKLKAASPNLEIASWVDMPIQGQLIFCEICKAQRFTSVAVADVTTMNFNVLFEIEYALGLGIPVLPIRDTTCCVDTREFDELGLLDTLGYIDFQNSDELLAKLPDAIREAKFPLASTVQRNIEQPVYVVKAPMTSDGQIKLLSTIKKSGLKFRTFDAKETSRISLQETFREVKSSTGLVAHLLMDWRRGSLVHNARAAFMSGLAMASGQYVCMLQEGSELRPIDYRDVVLSYTDHNKVQGLLTPFIRQIFEEIQSTRFVPITLPLRALESLDFGDVAAENEIKALRYYFVPTAQYNEARRGHARLIVGRKGTGKTAIFYGIRDAYWSSQDQLVLDMKPEGHQFTKLREAVLAPLSRGMQEHVLIAFWNYILLMELAHKVIRDDGRYAIRDHAKATMYEEIRQIYGADPEEEEGDFSDRLLTLVDKITDRSETGAPLLTSTNVTGLVYERNIRGLAEKLSKYLHGKKGVWLLVDNLDKGWPVNGAEFEDILLLRSLLEATRKLQRAFSRDNVEFNSVVFIRNDIYEHLLRETTDKGKDSAVLLEWTDEEALKQLVHRRMLASVQQESSFESLWASFFEPHVQGEASFSYLVRRTLMRPRDLLRLLRECVNVAVNRGHERVTENDVIQAENRFSEDQLQEVSFELRDISPEYSDVVFGFIGSTLTLDTADLRERLEAAGVKATSLEHVSHLLLWFAFIGVMNLDGEEIYSYSFQYGVDRMLREASSNPTFVIHPAFRVALGCC